MYKKVSSALLIGSLLFTLGCSYSTVVPETSKSISELVVVYKLEKQTPPSEGNLNKELYYNPPSKTPADKALLLIDLLKIQKEGSNLLPTVPEDVVLRRAEIKDHTLTLDFNEAVTKLGGGDAERIFIKSVNNTMVHAFSGSQETEFNKLVYQINGKTIKTLRDAEFDCNRGELCHEPFLSKATQ